MGRAGRVPRRENSFWLCPLHPARATVQESIASRPEREQREDLSRRPHEGDVSPAESRPPTRSCPVCGDAFVAVNRLAVYCGKRCGWAASRQRQKEKTYGPRQGRPQPETHPLPPDTDRPDLYADGWETGRKDALRDLRTHLPTTATRASCAPCSAMFSRSFEDG